MASGMPAALLEATPEGRARSPRYLDHVPHHQNTLYDATVPAALYVAAILPNPRTAATVDDERRPLPGPLRVHLLDHRTALAPLMRDVLGTSARWQYRERAY
jgi:hypothetical protein